ncbi:oxygenase MpaB family protein [Gordonia sp. DT30]|uniref:oxygenase MpaB family protein n=1 Tax=unclassified Gordonia (in: high G+C Gram-positive bacteria) TaxID=2657482 RepID=UPI003CE67912
MSRRNALRVGATGALGVAGAAAFGAKPARAQPWSWSPAGSVVGSGSGADPRNLWDPEADAVIADMIEHHDVPAINKALKGWVFNDQPVPRSLPSNLRDFLEDARTLPAWTDKRKLAASFTFVKKQDTLISVLYAFASGMMATVIPNEARAVYYSRGGSPLYFKDRIAKTAKLGYDIGTVNAYDPGGEMIVTCVKTRMIHSAVRHLLPQAPHWPAHVTPISQEDLMVTWHSLPTTIMQKMVEWKIPIPKNESDGYLHSWQLCGHFLGIGDEYLPASWHQADSQAAQALTPVLGPTPEGTVLAEQLLELGHDLDLSLLSKPILGAFTRFIMGDKLADWIQVPREPVWSPLLEAAWSPFVQIRSGVLGVVPPAENAYWLFDEFLRQFVLWYISELRMPISIEIPTANRHF